VGRPEWILMLHVFVFSQSQAVSPDFSASVVFRTLSFSPRPTFWPIYAVLTVWTKWGKKNWRNFRDWNILSYCMYSCVEVLRLDLIYVEVLRFNILIDNLVFTTRKASKVYSKVTK
jgi:hypothetical protein